MFLIYLETLKLKLLF